jgi:hypothetical protein
LNSEEQPEIIGYCKHFGAAFWGIDGQVMWNNIYCDGEWNGHELEEEDERA